MQNAQERRLFWLELYLKHGFLANSENNITKELIAYNNPSYTNKEFISQVSVPIHKRCMEENMLDRFKKAFRDMIKTCGGAVTDDAY